MSGWLVLTGIGGAAAAGWAVRVAVIPYRPCRTCRGRGLCVRCGFTGKKLRRGARWIRPGLKDK